MSADDYFADGGDDRDEDTDIDLMRMAAQARAELPPGFGEWERHQQADYLSTHFTRVGLIERIFILLEYEPDRDVSAGNKRLRKDELALIYMALGGVVQ